MKLSQYIANFIDTLGGEYTFGIAGVPNLAIYEALREKKIKIIQNVHETNSIYSSIGAYYYTQKPHFSVVTAGPGVTNVMTALSDAYLNDVPVFLISINSNSEFYGTGEKHDSSSGDNGIDTVHLTKNITCFSALGLSPKNAVLLMERAYKLCYYQKKPVHISLAKDFLNQDIGDPLDISSILGKTGDLSPSLVHEHIENCFSNIKNSLVILNAYLEEDSLTRNIEGKNIFIADTMKHFGHINHISSYIGCYEYIQNIAVQKVLKYTDTLIIIGGSITKHFFENRGQIEGKRIIHITDSPEKTENLQLRNYEVYIGDIEKIGRKIIGNLPKSQYSSDYIKKLKEANNVYYQSKYSDNINYHLYQYLNKNLPKNSSLFIGVGGSNNLANVFLRTENKVDVFLPSSFFNMGHCMKVIGYAHYNRDNPNFVIIGDGNYYMNGNDILTAVEQKLNLNVIVLNNNGYSSLSAWNNSDFLDDTKDGFNSYVQGMNFEYVAKSLGCTYVKVEKIHELKKIKTLNIYKGVNIIEVISPFLSPIPL